MSTTWNYMIDQLMGKLDSQDDVSDEVMTEAASLYVEYQLLPAEAVITYHNA